MPSGSSPRTFLRCANPACGRVQDSGWQKHRCSACGDLLDLGYDFALASAESLRGLWADRKLSTDPINRSGVWRFRELLPFTSSGDRVISLGEGGTPLIPTEHAAKWIGEVQLSVKHQGANPTGSFKDIGMTACITHAVSRGVCVVACASTGNTSSSMAAYAARAGLRALLFVPQGAISAAKLAQAADFGAVIVESGENFDQSFRLLNEIAESLDLYVVNSINPYRIEGQKTIVAELLEQRGWSIPGYIVVPGGNLGNVSSIGKGLRELQGLGLITSLPRLVVVQSAGANPFYRMLASGASGLTPIDQPKTEATAIRIGNPANWKKALREMLATHGLCESVTDEEIFEAKSILAADGIGCEPASAATLAGVRKLRVAGKIEPGADVVAIVTGNQLKDTDYTLKHRIGESAARQRIQIEPDPIAVRTVLRPLLAHTKA
jgi:threonine synthase